MTFPVETIERLSHNPAIERRVDLATLLLARVLRRGQLQDGGSLLRVVLDAVDEVFQPHFNDIRRKLRHQPLRVLRAELRELGHAHRYARREAAKAAS